MPNPPSTNTPHDAVLRAITSDYAFRLVVARTTDTVQGILAAQKATGVAARVLGDLVTGAVLVRETMAPSLRVQCILKEGGDRGSLVADSQPGGDTRGLVQRGSDEPFRRGDDALLQVMRTLPNGSLHQGVVRAGDEAGLSAALMAYMRHSEQVVSVIGVGTLFEYDAVTVAGGYIVQLLPEAGEAAIAAMGKHLASLADETALVADTAAAPAALVERLLGGAPYTTLEESPVRFACRCSDVRVIETLASLPRGDIDDMLREGKMVELGCDFCGKNYRVSPEQLRGLIQPS